MGHLNLAKVHPFFDGNGRTARCLEAAVWSLDGRTPALLCWPEDGYRLDEERYYEALVDVSRPGWSPVDDCKDWVRYCLNVHFQHSSRQLHQCRGIAALVRSLTTEIDRCGLPEWLLIPLIEASFGMEIAAGNYETRMGVSNLAVARELAFLADTGLIEVGDEKCESTYVASDRLGRLRRDHVSEAIFESPL